MLGWAAIFRVAAGDGSLGAAGTAAAGAGAPAAGALALRGAAGASAVREAAGAPPAQAATARAGTSRQPTRPNRASMAVSLRSAPTTACRSEPRAAAGALVTAQAFVS